jgi:hypothetical protein
MALRWNCVACARDLDHCHGTLVVHVDGGPDCTEPRCDDPDPVRHAMLVDCVSTALRCCVPDTVALRAS